MLLAQAGCEFQPLYGDRQSTPVEARLASVSVGVIADRTGQLLRNELLTRFDPNNKSLPTQYKLSVTLTDSTERLAVRRDASATRASLTIKAQFELVSIVNGEQVTSGLVRSVNSYDILDTQNEFGTRTAEEQARKRAASDLAEQISLRVGLMLDQTSGARR